MALRTAQTLLGTFIRAGVFCIAASAAASFNHGLPATPDSVLFSPTNTGQATLVSVHSAVAIQSWDSTGVIFTNSSHAAALNVRVAVEHSIIS